MTHDESLERIGVVALSINHIHYLLVMLFSLSEARCPIVASATTILGDEDIFVIE
jgi:hypothetical protein